MKRKLLLAALIVAGALGFNANAQEDVTNDYLKNADLSTNEKNQAGSWTGKNNVQDWQTNGDVPVVEFYSDWRAGNLVESMTRKDFKLSQKITLPAGDYRIAVNAFYRNGTGDGTNPDKGWIFATGTTEGTDGKKKQNVYALSDGQLNSYTGSNDLYKAANAFSKGDFSNEFDFTVAGEGDKEVEVGFEGYFDTTISWCILGPVKLYKYSLDAYIKDYEAKVPDAEALYNSPMNAEVLQNLQEAASVDVKSFQTSAPIIAAIKTLTDLIETAKKSIANYEAAKALLDPAENFDESGQAVCNGDDTYKELKNAYDDRSLEEVSEEQKTAIYKVLQAAAKAQTTPGSDMTWAIENWDFLNCGDRNFPGWTIGETTTPHGNVVAKDNTAVEYWTDNAVRSFDFYQILTNLPAGKYTIAASMWYSKNGVDGDSADGSAGVYGVSGNAKVYQGVDTETEYPKYITKTTDEIAVYDGTLRLGVKNDDTMGARWFGVDWIKLTFVEPLTSVTVNVTDAGYATFSTGSALDLSDIKGGKAYIALKESDGETITLEECKGIVPANTGLVIAGEDKVEISFAAAGAETIDVKDNLLVATDGGTVEADNYVLATPIGKSEAAFYVLEEPKDIEAGKAYLSADAVQKDNGAKVIRIVFGDENATAIETVATEAEADGALYNVAGQQVGKDYKGIVIKNGKKYLNK